jgi:hypothetical protein
MSLVLGTILCVLGATVVVGIVAWVVDRSTARQERQGIARKE